MSPRPRAPRLYEIDVVRILTFACVIAVHTTSHTVAADDVGLYAFLGLVHFTREVFFALSGFVLVHSYLARPVPMRTFWPRRFLLVGVPYLVWSAIYFAASNLHSPKGTALDMLVRFLQHVVTGTSWYHLYFLLVTMQVYLLVPVIVWLVRRTRGHHGVLLAAAGAFQLLLTAYYAYLPLPAWLSGYSKVYFFSYLFFILLGAVSADHSTALFGWVRGHRPLIGFITLATGLLTLAVFAFQHFVLGFSLYHSGTPLQPILMVWSAAVGLAFLAIGSYWADRRRAGSLSARGVDVASDRSFGIFLSHPLILWVLLWVGDDWLPRTVAKPWLTLVAYVVVVVGSVILTELARRSPLSLALTGRPSARRKRPLTPAQADAGAVPPD
ncbi:MAG TPA: acyltransferase [Lacisediminihabitans sp.]|uniref:acyltransferase n=1 Tax=Lacisediminihabitans sp. TaxID=2787631 RepID=UPI002EDB85A6